MKPLPVVLGGSMGTSAGVLVLRPSTTAILTAAVVQLASVGIYGLIQRSVQGQSQRNAHKLLEQAKDGRIAVIIHDTGRIDVIPTKGLGWLEAPDSERQTSGDQPHLRTVENPEERRPA